MNEPDDIAVELAGLLREHRDELIAAWIELTDRRWPDTVLVRNHPVLDRWAGCDRLLGSIDDFLTRNCMPEANPQQVLDARGGIALGLTIEQDIDIWLQLQEIVLPLVCGLYAAQPVKLQSMIARLEATVRIFTARAAYFFATELNRKRLEEHERAAVLEERQRLARDLHDNLSQVLGSLSLRTERLDRLLIDGNVTAARVLGREMHGISRQAYADVRAILFALRAPAEVQFGLLPAIEHCLREYRKRQDLEAELVIDSESLPPFPIEARLHIMCLIQEALTNIYKHAQASRVRVSICQKDSWTEFTIEDDGCGFVLEQVCEATGCFGLSSMRERATMLDGTISIISHPGAGTRILLRVPSSPGTD